MALELAPKGILVNAVAPGSTLTEVTRKLFYGEDGSFHDRTAAFMKHVPLGRPGEPEEIAQGVLFLAAPAQQLRQRPLPHDRWRLDRRLHDVSACSGLEELPVDAIGQAALAEIGDHHLDRLPVQVLERGRAVEGGVRGQHEAAVDPALARPPRLDQRVVGIRRLLRQDVERRRRRSGRCGAPRSARRGRRSARARC